ncbi:MAG: hypothetical protein NT113_11195, partial [Hyphomicrobiales bacterium]|nr:hypothetical protein [Hyphomicrobiales bacterium]
MIKAELSETKLETLAQPCERRFSGCWCAITGAGSVVAADGLPALRCCQGLMTLSHSSREPMMQSELANGIMKYKIRNITTVATSS